MVHTSTPGGRRLYGPRTLADAERRGLRLISYDRPGYGGSTPQPGRSTADCASDVRVICAALGINRLAMWGLSGGGPHVLACAALLPDLVPAVAALASLAPYDAEGYPARRLYESFGFVPCEYLPDGPAGGSRQRFRLRRP
jgi:pimeloyl-ACP methyl ester carboxylesterase